MAAQMQSLSTIFEFNFPKRFCKNNSKLFLRGNKFDLDGVVLDLLSGKVVVDLEMFGLFVEHRIVTKLNTA